MIRAICDDDEVMGSEPVPNYRYALRLTVGNGGGGEEVEMVTTDVVGAALFGRSADELLVVNRNEFKRSLDSVSKFVYRIVCRVDGFLYKGEIVRQYTITAMSKLEPYEGSIEYLLSCM